jgi:hypothetical protein
MKPRTKAQFRVVEMSQYVSIIKDEVFTWAKKECLEHRAYATKNNVLCLDCGETFSPTLVSRNKATCTHCKTKVQVKQSRCTTDRQVNYFAVTELVVDYQVVRNFEIIVNYKKGRPADYYIHEILQYWIPPDKKVVMFGKSHNTQGFCDSWGGDMEIRTESNSYYSVGKYDVYARKYHPSSVVEYDYQKLGIDHNLSGISFLEAIRLLPNNPKSETLLKAKEYELLAYYNNQSGIVSRYWDSVKIAMRHKYKIKDASMYFDYLEMLQYFKKDLHSPKYVCPKNLHREHNRLMKKRQEIRRLQDLENERLKVIERQKNLEKAIVQYIEQKKKLFDLEFKEKDISINVLQSVEEFLEEGTELNHCIYTNEYYLKEDSIILSAKVKGKRTETIEVILSKLKVEQCRGNDNKPTKHHKKILELINKNLPKIRAVLEQSKVKKKRNQKKSLIKNQI